MLITKQMLEFKEVFSEGSMVCESNEGDIIKCKNIEFDHVCWVPLCFTNATLTWHIIHNIVDINIVEHQNGGRNSATLLDNIIFYTYDSNVYIEYILNNVHISNKLFASNSSSLKLYKYKGLVKYLTKVSLGRFTRFYNIQKYYDTCVIVLLVMKSLQFNKQITNSLPSNIIKHLIVPFVYQ